ncbi:MAG: YdcH family protein [Pseudomonadota bacterium]
MHDHLVSLKGKHAMLDAEVEQEQQRPMPDQSVLLRLKKEKLRLKDQILRLEESPAAYEPRSLH